MITFIKNININFFIFLVIIPLSLLRGDNNNPNSIIENEKYAIFALNEISLFQGPLSEVNQDHDNKSEALLLNELSGYTNMRGYKERPLSSKYHFSRTCQFKVAAPLNYATVEGYHFQIFLPHINQPLTDTGYELSPSIDQNSIDAQEKYFIAYAWPEKFGITGYRCFALYYFRDRDRDVAIYKINVMESSNKKENGTFYYSGVESPLYYAAMPRNKSHLINSLHWELPSSGETAMDGQVWRVCDFKKEFGENGIMGYFDEKIKEK